MQDKELIERIRRFNRFYIQFFGLYSNRFLESKFSLTEARVFFELGSRKLSTSKEIISALKIDRGYMSRMINKFEKNGYVKRESSLKDGRKQIISLTAKGDTMFNKLDNDTNNQVEEILKGINSDKKKKLVDNLNNIELLLYNS